MAATRSPTLNEADALFSSSPMFARPNRWSELAGIFFFVSVYHCGKVDHGPPGSILPGGRQCASRQCARVGRCGTRRCSGTQPVVECERSGAMTRSVTASSNSGQNATRRHASVSSGTVVFSSSLTPHERWQRARTLATPDCIAIARGLRTEKETWHEIANGLQISSASVQRALLRSATEDNHASV